MSFDSICQGCGAPSGPSVGICPFCKNVMSVKVGKDDPSFKTLAELHQRGQLERALCLGLEMEQQKPEVKNDLSFVIPYVQILIETEGPTSKIRSLLTSAQMHSPENPDLINYLEIMAAKILLRKGADDEGEIMLRNVLKRSPKNVHAHFILGAHMFWVDNESALSISHLEASVRLHPNFLSAWGCLGAIYKKLGNIPLSQMAFAKCAKLESNLKMKEFFEAQAR